MQQVNNLIDLNLWEDKREYPYILTIEEEIRAMDFALQANIEHQMWLLKDKRGDVIAKAMFENGEIVPRVERDRVLEEANKRKHWDNESKILEEERNEKLKAEIAERNRILNETKDPKYFFKHMRSTHEKKYKSDLYPYFVYDSQSKCVINPLCLFLSDSKQFENLIDDNGNKCSLKKGLWFRGGYGVGKTHPIKCVKDNLRHPIEIYSLIGISKEIERHGAFIPQYSDILNIGDVGAETSSTVMHFGTKVNWFSEFIQEYYLSDKPFNKLIVDTNENFDSIENRYGGRVRDRIPEMFNIFDVVVLEGVGGSRRKKFFDLGEDKKMS